MLAGHEVASLPVFVALGTILGHNFPVYLRFRGGKGVATSLGALLALDTAASLASTTAFVVFLLVTRVVSLSSVLGALAFVFMHFARADRPWQGDQLPMSLLTVALLALVVVRHRKNFARIAAGTEPRVSFRKRRQEPKDDTDADEKP